MSLQGPDLTMIALGMWGDVPPVAEQPPLADGVHLRWTAPRDRLFPWHGYYLFRRPANSEKLSGCLDLGRAAPIAQGQLQANLPEGRLTSTATLAFEDVFAPSGTLELAVRTPMDLRFDRPAGRPAHFFQLRVAFHDGAERQCLDLSKLEGRDLRLPFTLEGLEFRAASRRAGGTATRLVLGADRPGRGADGWGLLFSGTTEIMLPAKTRAVEVQIGGGGTATLSLDRAGKPVGEAVEAPDKHATYRLDLGLDAQKKGVRLRIAAKDAPVWIGQICLWRGAGQAGRVRAEGIDVIPGPGQGLAVVARQEHAGGAGDEVDITLAADRMTGLRLIGQGFSLLSLCWRDVHDQATQGWEALKSAPQPVHLPVRDPDYPAALAAPDLPQSEAEALALVRYGNPADWAGSPFADLHGQCAALVVGGPAAGPMAAASRAVLAVPPVAPPAGLKVAGLQSLHPLDMVTLGALHPPLAQMIGLYFVDETADPASTYDYMVVADHAGVAKGKAEHLLDRIINNGFPGGVDAWICFALRAEPQPPLTPPSDLRAHALPGGTVRPGAPGTAPLNIAGSVGLTWPAANLAQGWLTPGAQVLHHLWRCDAGIGALPALPPGATDWLTKTAPILRAMPAAAPTAPPQPPSDWPPFAQNHVDFRLPEGWHGYQLAGVDLFGRFTPKSAYAAWWQWSPAPQPLPWYQAADVAAVVHPQAVRIVDAARPPVPIGLEAFVLDPADPLVVQDAAYQAWRTALGPAGAGLVGLRVRWRWTADQQQAAPGVTEFRLYWSAGSAPPTAWPAVQSWSDRFFVCPFGAHVTVVGDERRYDVFLPRPPGAALATGVPLTPSLSDPIAYANVSVTAADNAAWATDRWPGAGPYAGRPGKEGDAAAPQRVFKVHRTPPPPPAPVVDSDKVYATAADWQGQSYHSFRWRPQPHVLTHVLKAIDEAVFEADWAQQPRPALSAADPAFPDAAGEPIWTAAKKALVAGQINALAALLPPGASADQRRAARPGAFAAYRALSDDALRVLASRSGNERAFSQITVAALDAAQAPDRRGPDDPAGYMPQAGRCAYLVAVDGRAVNRLLFRAQFVDGAQNRSAPGPCSTPVRLPDVAPPAAPKVIRVTGGDRAITLVWASGREADLMEYQVYRSDSEEAARDLRQMTRIASLAAPPDPALRPPEVTYTDAGVPGRRDLWYRVVARDRPDPDPRGLGGNLSAPSPALRARAYDETPPVPPDVTAVWAVQDRNGTILPYSTALPDAAARHVVHLTWPGALPDLRLLVQVQTRAGGAFSNVSGWLPPGTAGFVDPRPPEPGPLTYRLKVVNVAGNANTTFSLRAVTLPTV